MKDKIYLIWSGNTTVAYKVKRILEEQYNYICFVGGNFENSSMMLSVGDTVLRQMKACNQAVVIFQNREDGHVSNNLFFELGFVAGTYGMKKVHCVKRKSENIQLPSDFDNSFVEDISAEDDDAYAENIVSYFMKRQKLSIETNKMFLINNRHIIHEMLQAHYSEAGSRCSDYELAQYVLFYMQAAVMYQDDAKVLDELISFKKAHNAEFSTELNEAVNLSISMLQVQTGLQTKDDIVFLSEETFRSYFNACKDMLDIIKDDDSGSFDEWAKVIASENLAYACSLYAYNPEIKPEMRIFLLQKTLEYGKRCLAYIDVLEKNTPSMENNDSIGLIAVFRAYVYRHMFLAGKELKSEDTKKWLEASLSERRSLMRNFDKNSVDSKIYSNFEMEYYLNLIEYMTYFGKETMDEFDYMMYLTDIDHFIDALENKNGEHAYIRKIESQRKKMA